MGSNRLKKTLAIFLVILFLVSLTTSAVSAFRPSNKDIFAKAMKDDKSNSMITTDVN